MYFPTFSPVLFRSLSHHSLNRAVSLLWLKSHFHHIQAPCVCRIGFILPIDLCFHCYINHIVLSYSRLVYIFLFLFPWPHVWHLKFPRLGVESELQLPVYTTAPAKPDPSHVCNLCCSLRYRWILKPLSKARDRTHILMDTSQFFNPQSHYRNPCLFFYKANFL